MTDKNQAKEHTVVMECYHCKKVVLFEELYRYSDSIRNSDLWNIAEIAQVEDVLLRCRDCREISLFTRYSEMIETHSYDNKIDWVEEWSEYERLYPSKRKLGHYVRGSIRESFKEAQKLYENGFFNPAMTSLRRTLENICLEKGISKSLTLELKLKKLFEQNIIDQKLYDWGEALRLAGNLTAHSNEQIKKEDLQDMFDFIELMINYIFVLSKKFESYKARHLVVSNHK